jgi:hypothetical protein
LGFIEGDVNRDEFVTTSVPVVSPTSDTLASMKHASESTLLELTSLLDRLRSFEALVEKRPGVFYRKTKAFMHFHEDPTGLFVDVRLKADEPFTRLPVTTSVQQSTLIAKVERVLRQPHAPSKARSTRASR